MVAPCMGRVLGGVTVPGGVKADKADPEVKTNWKCEYTLALMAR